ncbi:MAG: hypothetical protein WB791_00055 [Waddliaceae bacterium]
MIEDRPLSSLQASPDYEEERPEEELPSHPFLNQLHRVAAIANRIFQEIMAFFSRLFFSEQPLQQPDPFRNVCIRQRREPRRDFQAVEMERKASPNRRAHSDLDLHGHRSSPRRVLERVSARHDRLLIPDVRDADRLSSERDENDSPIVQFEKVLKHTLELFLEEKSDEIVNLLFDVPIQQLADQEDNQGGEADFLNELLPGIRNILIRCRDSQNPMDGLVRRGVKNAIKEIGKKVGNKVIAKVIDLIQESDQEEDQPQHPLVDTPYKKIFAHLIEEVSNYTQKIARGENFDKEEDVEEDVNSRIKEFAREVIDLVSQTEDLILQDVIEEVFERLEDLYSIPNGTIEELEEHFYDVLLKFIQSNPGKLPDFLKKRFEAFLPELPELMGNLRQEGLLLRLINTVPKKMRLKMILFDFREKIKTMLTEQFTDQLESFLSPENIQRHMADSVFPSIRGEMTELLVKEIILDMDEAELSELYGLFYGESEDLSEDSQREAYKRIHEALYTKWQKRFPHSFKRDDDCEDLEDDISFRDFEKLATPLTKEIRRHLNREDGKRTLPESLADFCTPPAPPPEESVVPSELYDKILQNLIIDIGGFVQSSWVGWGASAAASYLPSYVTSPLISGIQTAIRKKIAASVHVFQTSPDALLKKASDKIDEKFGSQESLQRSLRADISQDDDIEERLQKEKEKTAQLAYDLIPQMLGGMPGSRQDTSKGYLDRLKDYLAKQGFSRVFGSNPNYLAQLVEKIYTKIFDQRQVLIREFFVNNQMILLGDLKRMQGIPLRPAVVHVAA